MAIFGCDFALLCLNCINDTVVMAKTAASMAAPMYKQSGENGRMGKSVE